MTMGSNVYSSGASAHQQCHYRNHTRRFKSYEEYGDDYGSKRSQKPGGRTPRSRGSNSGAETRCGDILDISYNTLCLCAAATAAVSPQASTQYNNNSSKTEQ